MLSYFAFILQKLEESHLESSEEARLGREQKMKENADFCTFLESSEAVRHCLSRPENRKELSVKIKKLILATRAVVSSAEECEEKCTGNLLSLLSEHKTKAIQIVSCIVAAVKESDSSIPVAEFLDDLTKEVVGMLEIIQITSF